MADLFDNPMVKAARESMTPEQIAEYQEKGKAMYNTVEFENNTIIGDDDPLEDFIAYISVGLNSGLHPMELETDEKLAMSNKYGSEWYKRFGYESID